MVTTAKSEAVTLVKRIPAPTLWKDLVDIISSVRATSNIPCRFQHRIVFRTITNDVQQKAALRISCKKVSHERCSLLLVPQRFLLRSSLEPLTRTQGLLRNQLIPATKRITRTSQTGRTLEPFPALHSSISHTQYYKLQPCHFNSATSSYVHVTS